MLLEVGMLLEVLAGRLRPVPGHLGSRGCSPVAYWEHVAASKGLDEDERLVSGERLVMYGVYSHS